MPDEDTLLTQTNTNAEEVVEQQAENSTPSQDEAQMQNPPDEEQSKAAQTETEESNEDDQEAGAPDEYSDFEVPESYSINEETLSDYQQWAKENNLTQEQAQAGVNMVTKMRENEVSQWVEQQKAWVSQAKTDTEIGGDDFNKNVSTAVKARDSFGTAEFSTMLDVSGLGNHPEMIRFLNRVGKAISEDRVVVSGANASQKTRENVLYPSMK
jgi:hypothetical protein